jgi:hypothetical protein
MTEVGVYRFLDCSFLRKHGPFELGKVSRTFCEARRALAQECGALSLQNSAEQEFILEQNVSCH